MQNQSNNNKKGPSQTAEGMAMLRLSELAYPEDQRICNDIYAPYFVNAEFLQHLRQNPKEAEMLAENLDRQLPGMTNIAIGRIRYFDDYVKASLGDGFGQLVILGAGYDTRAYRIDGVNKIKVFEVDHPDTQALKMEKVKGIFGSLPGHVSYVAADLAVDDLIGRLTAHGYDPSKKTLFLLEGLSMYLTPDGMDRLLALVVHDSGKGSSVVFDYISEAMMEGTCADKVAINFRAEMARWGEPLLFGINEGTAEAFLARRGFSRVRDVGSEEVKKLYFQGKNAHRQVGSLIRFASGVVE